MSVRLNFWVVEGILLDKQYYDSITKMRKEGQLEGLQTVSCDPMSDSDFIVGRVLYRYTDEMDDEELSKATLIHDPWYRDMSLYVKLLGIANKLEIEPVIKTYALTEMS